MATEKDENENMISVPETVLVKLQEQIASLEQKVEDGAAKNAGLEELFRTADTTGEPKIREKKDFAPKFRTVRLRKYPVGGDFNNMGVVIGWSDRGAYQEIDTAGITRQVVDYIEVFFLNQEKSESGKRKAEKVKLLDLINNSTQLVCKVVNEKKETKHVETGEEIEVTEFDPKHGLVGTGEKVDGFYTYSDIQYELQVPGVGQIWIDSKFCNQ